jgi:hypothetical protein
MKGCCERKRRPLVMADWVIATADRKSSTRRAVSIEDAKQRPLSDLRLDDAQQPKDEDQQQDAAETDIHDTLLLLVLLLKRGAKARRSSRFDIDMKFVGYYFTRRQSAGFA